MKCFYKIVMEDGKVIPYFVPNSLKNTDQDMFYFDYFALSCGTKKDFYEQIKKLANIKNGEIKKITIDYKRDKNNKNHNPYNIEFSNPYVNEALRTLDGKFINIKRQRVRVLGKNVFDDDVVTVDKNSDLYKNTCDYLFDNLRNNSEVFFKSIYNKDNDYSKILRNYATLYQSTKDLTATNDEFEELDIKERDIKDHLSKYSVFRSFVMARYKYDQRLKRNEANKIKKEREKAVKLLEKLEKQLEREEKRKEKEILKIEKERFKEEKQLSKEMAKLPKPDPMDGLMDVSDYFERYNQEYDEYIEENEYEQMAPNGSVPRR